MCDFILMPGGLNQQTWDLDSAWQLGQSSGQLWERPKWKNPFSRALGEAKVEESLLQLGDAGRSQLAKLFEIRIAVTGNKGGASSQGKSSSWNQRREDVELLEGIQRRLEIPNLHVRMCFRNFCK